MANLDFDPLFEPGPAESNGEELEPEKMATGHRHSAFLSGNLKNVRRRNTTLFWVLRVIDWVGGASVVASMLYVVWHCVFYWGIL